MIIGSNQVMEKSNLTSRFDNSDHDGDSLIALALHSEQAREDFKYANVRNLVEFEHMDELLIDYEHESIYSSYMLTKQADENRYPYEGTSSSDGYSLFEETFKIQDFVEKPGSIKVYNDFDEPAELTRVEAAINFVLLKKINDFFHISEPIYLIEKDGILTKKNLLKLTKKFLKIIQLRNKDVHELHQHGLINFWDIIHEFDKFLLECSGAVSYCSPSFDLQDFVVSNEEIDTFKENLLEVEPFLAFHQNMVLFEKVSDELSKQESNILNLVFKSGARLKSVQLLKAASNTGIPTDIYGKAFGVNIKNSLLDGLTQEEYFIAGDSARLALAQRQEAIPKGGELQRKFFFTVGILKLDKDIDNCQKDIPIEQQKTIPILIKNTDHLKLMNHRYYKSEKDEVFKIDVDSENEEMASRQNSLIGKIVNFYSPITCQCKNYKICKQCFGDKLPDSVNLGSLVGAALSEGIIQSVLRTHHFGGAFIAAEDSHLLDIMRRVEFKAPDTIIGNPKDIEYIVDYLNGIYSEEEWEYETLLLNTKTGIKIKINELPFNDDSVKVLNGIVGLIDRNRDESSLIQPSDLYNQLEHVIEQNGILSTYLELVISLLYYDEDGVLLRYSPKEVNNQVALKNIIEVLDPKLSIFYNFSNRIISKIYNKEVVEPVDHMYHDLLDIYR